jgi:prephenate dehydrogenase
VRTADLVVIAAPVDRIVPLVREIAPSLKPGAIVTDVGSVKAEICRLAAAALPAGMHFIGSHPMAGSERTGWEHSTATLFQNRTCFVTPLDGADAAAGATVAAFWRDLGSEPVSVAPDRHDEIVAHISHLPQVLASTLCAFLTSKDHAWRNYAGAACATPRASRAATRNCGAPSWNKIATKCCALWPALKPNCMACAPRSPIAITPR